MGTNLPNSGTPRAALAALLTGAVLIGLAPIFVRLADVGPTAAAFWRVALAAPLLLVLWWPRRARHADRRARLPWLLQAGAFFAADLAATLPCETPTSAYE